MTSVIHPSDKDLDELESALAGPDLEDLDLNSERYLRAVRSLRVAYSIATEQLLQSEEEFDSTPFDDFEAAYERLLQHIKEKENDT